MRSSTSPSSKSSRGAGRRSRAGTELAATRRRQGKVKLSPILKDLFAPLRYAAREGGALAHNLKGVGQLCERLVTRAVREGAELESLRGLLQAARAFDQAAEAEKA